LRHSVKQNTVDRLKQIIAGFNDECSTNLAKSGKKQELIDRIHTNLDLWRTSGAVDKWQKARTIIHQVRTSGA
jgi:E3 SUMO-protein ligase PIAS1